MIFHLVEYILSEKASAYVCMYVNIFQEIMSSRDSTKDTNATNAQIALSRSHSRKFEYIIPKTQK